MGAIQPHQVDLVNKEIPFCLKIFSWKHTWNYLTSRDPIQYGLLTWINTTFLGPYVFKCFLAIISCNFNMDTPFFSWKNFHPSSLMESYKTTWHRRRPFFGSALSDGVRQNTLEPFSPSLISPRLAEGSSEGKESWWNSVVTLLRGSG